MSIDHSAWAQSYLALSRARLQCAVERRDSARAWPVELIDTESRVDSAAAEVGDELPITWLTSRLCLSRTERRVVWTLLAQELCPIARSLLRSLAEAVADPTTDALRQAAYDCDEAAAARRELAPDGVLRRWRLIERIDQGADVPEYRQTWRVASRLLALIYGETRPDGELTDLLATPLSDAQGIGGAGIEADAASNVALHAAVNAARKRGTGTIVVQGRRGSGRRSLLASVAHAQRLQVIEVEARAIAKEREPAQRQLRALARECRLLQLVPMIRDLDVIAVDGDANVFDVVEAEFTGLIALATSSRPIARRWLRPPRTIELRPLTGSQLARLWSRALPQLCDADTQHLATMYAIAPALIAGAAKIANEQAAHASLTPTNIADGLRAVLDDRLAGLANRVTVQQDWSDLVLPDDQASSIIELLARIRQRRVVYEEWGFGVKVGRGIGVSALFSGPPGTGKTMAAGLIANELGTALYQVDVSKVISKWIGETEKNLAALFDAAEAGQAILLFDEADALFGKRTDVKSSNDRHANQETNFLLQRLESFSGICILTTNHEDAIDEAFRRRLSIHVQFPIPEADERTRLWRALIPPTAPVASTVDFGDLAERYEMSGGYIRNAVLRAAFHAADDRVAIGPEHLARAAQLEFQAMGRLIASTH